MSVRFVGIPLSRRQAILGAAAMSGLAACDHDPAPATPPARQAGPRAAIVVPLPAPLDAHSRARPLEARVRHVALDLTADFETRRLSGTATLDLAVAPTARELVLDTAGGLEPLAVTTAEGAALPFALGPADPILGRALTIQLGSPAAQRVVVRYRTAPEAGALQWLAPELTAGGREPYLFSQGQAILTRSWVPTQDSPGLRQTWEARIVAPEPLVAVMSGESVDPQGLRVEGGRAFRYRMPNPVPPYLIAVAIGDIAFRSLGERAGVYTEPSMLEAAAGELVDVNRMIEAAERLYGPYRWGRYDVLVLPPSFPFGGMENPTLTFATPTILAGDRSLVSLIAHELAHSWSGNLVTNANWNDFWLNEGFTVYFEARIMEALYGRERADMLRALGWQDLQTTLAETAPADTRLAVDFAGRDPDEGVGDIAYEKGAAFLRSIEAAVGRPRFDAWLRGYFDRYAFQPMTTERFLADLRANLTGGDAALEQRINADGWIRQPGLPPQAMAPTSTLLAVADAQARVFATGGAASTLQTQGWVSQQWQRFLGALPRELPAERLAQLDETFRFSRTGNSEVLFDWLELTVANRWEPAVPALETFLTRQGRRKFVLPLYVALLAQGDWGRPIARRIYTEARGRYHPLTVRSVDEAFETARVTRS